MHNPKIDNGWNFFFIVMAFLLVSCDRPDTQPHLIKDDPQEEKAITTPSGLIYEIIENGTGPIAKTGDNVVIHETTQTKNGTLITDTWESNFPIPFLLGGNQVIDGLDVAVTGMRVGERRKLIVPPSLSKRTSYPEDGKFKPEDTLYYDVLLVQIKN